MDSNYLWFSLAPCRGQYIDEAGYYWKYLLKDTGQFCLWSIFFQHTLLLVQFEAIFWIAELEELVLKDKYGLFSTACLARNGMDLKFGYAQIHIW